MKLVSILSTVPTLATLAVATLLSACGGVQHATRPGQGGSPRDPTLVEVRTTGYDGPHRIVSYSTWDVDPNGDLPREAPRDVVSEMRAEAARQGAEMLLLERFDDAWRKVWLGLGAVRDPNAVVSIPPCEHGGFQLALDDARARAISCTKGLLYDRPQLRGQVNVVFEVDANGRVLRAAPTPDSSRDQGLQQCVVGAVHETGFGQPEGYSCRSRVGITIISGTEVR